MGLDNEDIKQLIAILKKGLEDDSDTEDSVEVPRRKKRKTQQSDAGDNLFEKMPESRMHKDDVEIDKKLNRAPPTQRSRSFVPVTISCRVCGKKDKVNPVLVESADRYKCNKCAMSAG